MLETLQNEAELYAVLFKSIDAKCSIIYPTFLSTNTHTHTHPAPFMCLNSYIHMTCIDHPVCVCAFILAYLSWNQDFSPNPIPSSLALRYTGLVAPRHVGPSFPDQGSNSILCTGRRILTHWTAREVPLECFQYFCVSDSFCTVKPESFPFRPQIPPQAWTSAVSRNLQPSGRK